MYEFDLDSTIVFFRVLSILFAVKVELDKSLAHEAAGYNQQALLICKVKKANPLPTMVWYYQDWSCVSPKNCEPTDQDWKKQFPRVMFSYSYQRLGVIHQLLICQQYLCLNLN